MMFVELRDWMCFINHVNWISVCGQQGYTTGLVQLSFSLAECAHESQEARSRPGTSFWAGLTLPGLSGMAQPASKHLSPAPGTTE